MITSFYKKLPTHQIEWPYIQLQLYTIHLRCTKHNGRQRSLIELSCDTIICYMSNPFSITKNQNQSNPNTEYISNTIFGIKVNNYIKTYICSIVLSGKSPKTRTVIYRNLPIGQTESKFRNILITIDGF